MPPIFCVVSLGRGRGKTRLIERIVSELSKLGVRVATIKHSRENVDLADKDSYRHLEAGAIETSIISPSELITIRRAQASLDDAIRSLHVEADLILLEGFKESSYPKILCAEDEREAEEALKRISDVRAIILRSPGSMGEISGVRVMGEDEVLELLRKSVMDYWVELIPGLDCGKCRYGSCQGMAEAIRRGEAMIRDCVMRGLSKARVIVDGVEVPLGPWPQQLLHNLVRALVSSLKLGEQALENARMIVVEVRLGGGSSGDG
ncbi:MAG: molybdopterin-guanine dinucleotide biosynthesis protein B [Aigarchaeota archaeon]|nr:molybdopterin-guanine dinucleotide biosynthesis protein B [Candidatus Wolframiiraptor gerlachensis]